MFLLTFGYKSLCKYQGKGVVVFLFSLLDKYVGIGLQVSMLNAHLNFTYIRTAKLLKGLQLAFPQQCMSVTVAPQPHNSCY